MKSITRNPIQHLIYLLPVTFLALVGCGTAEPPPHAAPPPPAVTVDNAEQRTVTEFAEFTGKTQATKTVEIRSRVEGYLQEIHFTPGAYVEEGDLLFVIDPKPYEARVREMEAQLVSREADLALTETTYERRKNAHKDNAINELAVMEARAQQDQAKAAVEAAKAMLETVRLDLGYAEIRSPISGRVGRNMVDVGNLIRMSENTVLTTVVADDPIYVYFTLSERELLLFKGKLSTFVPGQGPAIALGLADGDDFPFQGRLDYLDNRLDAGTGTLQARGVIPNGDHRLVSGMFARVRIPVLERQNALLVPETTLGIDQQGRYLLVVDDQNMASYRPVQIGALIENKRVITAGLTLEDKVILNAGGRVRPGSPVTVNSPAASGSGASPAAPGGTQ